VVDDALDLVSQKSSTVLDRLGQKFYEKKIQNGLTSDRSPDAHRNSKRLILWNKRKDMKISLKISSCLFQEHFLKFF